MEMQDWEHEIAVVGMSCRFPGANNPPQFWKNLCAGVEAVSFLSDDELLAAGVRPDLLWDPSYVRAHGVLADAYAFDAPFFGVSQREAQIMDPQQRVFLECAWSALEDAGCDPTRFAGGIGVFAGSGGSGYLARVLAHPELADAVGDAAVMGNKPDFLTTRVSYKLGLRGPSAAVQTACSTSLVAIHLACQSLLSQECDLALAGGVTISPEPRGYRYQEGGIFSPDGHCRAFDAHAAGTVGGSGAGVVALKRMADAVRDGDFIHAVVKGSAINNDGAAKVGFTAPSVPGQAQAITEALAVAGVDPHSVSYVETHGTGTPLGDPIEVAALAAVYGGGGRRTPCFLGAVKTNVGHLDTAAGVAGFIKAVLALRHRTLPPTLHFQAPHPETGLEGLPFSVVAQLRPWESDGSPRRAGVSSFGIGGTNAHVVLEEAPELPVADEADSADSADSADAPAASKESKESEAPELLVLSAKSAPALERTRANLARHLEEHPGLSLASVAHTLREGRAAHPHRWAAVARGVDQAREALEGAAARPPSARRAAERPPVAFLFPGGGTQYPGMARELYAREPVFRAEIDACAEAVAPELGVDLRALLAPADDGLAAAREQLERIPFALPALFAVEYALAQLWMSWGVRPEAMLGHSMGEYAAATLAGVFTREGAVRLVAARARLMQSAPAGAMLAVPLPERELRPLLSANVALAAVNSASHCVVSGTTARVGEIEARLAADGVVARRLHVSVASHSPAMDPILEAFEAEVRRARPAAPNLPFLSNVTGDWITPEQATDPQYWVRHLRQTVRFADGVARLLEDPERVLLEVGPGEALGTFARRDSGGADRVIVRSLATADQADDAGVTMLEAAGALWTAGVELDWAALRRGVPRRRTPLPTYPFERTEYRLPRITLPSPVPAPAAASASALDAAPGGPRVSVAAALESLRPPDPPSEPMATETAAPPARLARIAGRVAEILARLLGTAPGEVDPSRSFLELGADSLLLMQASRTVESTFGVRVPFRMMLEGVPTPGALAAHLDRQLPPDPEPEPAAAPAPPSAPVAEAPAPPAAAAIPVSAPAGDAPAMQAIFAQQLALVQTVIGQQMEILRGAAAPAPAASASAGNGRHADPSAASASSSPAAMPAPSAAPLASPAATDAPADAPASHGPHRPIRQTLGQGGGYTERQARHFEELVRGYNARTRRSKEYAAENRPWLSDNRAALGFRLATKELLYPVVGERSEGSRIWDLDGNEYIDFTCGFGVHFFGHRPAFVVQAVEEQLRRGFHLGPQSDLAGPAARLLCELTGVERATFCNTGTDAMMTAVRIARAATGRDRIAVFEGAYHGCFDGVLARGGGWADGEPRTLPVAPGTPQRMVDDVVVLQYGAPESLEWLRANAAGLAAVLVEPAPSSNSELHPREFLRELRALTERAGTVLVFDEIITGLRLGVRGAQAFYGIDADLVTYGKVIGGGFPIGVVAGRARLMDAIDGGQWRFGDDSFPAADQTFFAGTFCKHPVTMAAALAVLRHLRESGPGLYDELNARTARLVAALREVIAQAGAPIRIVHFASRFTFRVDTRETFAALLFYHLLQRGMYIWEARGCFLSTAHTDEDCDRLVEALRDSLRALRDGGFLPGEPAAGGAAPLPVDGAGSVPAPTAELEAAPLAAGLELLRAPGAPDGPRSFPLTPAQRQIWAHAQLSDDASRAYNEQAVFGLATEIDPAVLRAAVEDVMLHHEALRTVFAPSGQAQHVLPALAPDVRVEARVDGGDPGALERALREAAYATLDLAAGPLFRVHLHPRAGGAPVVQVVFHHLAIDGLGIAVMLRDLHAALEARLRGQAPRLPAAMQFSEYAALLAAQAGRHDRGEAEWLARFRGAVPLVLPADRPRPRFPSHRGGRTVATLPPALVAALRELGRRQGCTLHMVLLGGFLATLHRVSGQDDVVVGISSAGRSFPGADTLVGCCVDALPVRSRVDGETTLGAYLKAVRGWLLDAYEHEVFSLALLNERQVTVRDPGLPPLVSVSFNLEPGGGQAAAAREEPGDDAGRFSKLDMSIDAMETAAGVQLITTYGRDLFDRPTVRRMLGFVRRVLEQAAGDPAARLAELELMDAAGRRRVVEEWNRTGAPWPDGRCVHTLFEEQAARTPGALAVAFGEEALSYRELNERANRLAHHLVELGVRPETRVGVCLERGPEQVAAVLAVLKAGGAYLPLDPAYPAERLAFVLADAAAPVLVTQTALLDTLPVGGGVAVVRVDGDAARIAARPAENPATGVGADNLAYVIYTSGSTGTPKGVMVPHRGVPNLAWAQARRFGIGEGSRVLQFASPAFDAAAAELFDALLTGATLVLAPRDGLLPGPGLLDTLRRGRVSVATLPPPVLAVLPPDGLPELRTVVSAGEAVDAAIVERWSAGRAFVNAYGPTEITVCATTAACEADGRVPPIGGPIENVRVYVLDPLGRPAPVGVPGELYVGGVGVARGYLGRPALTAERFVPDAFGPEPGARLYRTGDRVRWTERESASEPGEDGSADAAARPRTGTLEFLGRLDAQVKVRGFRIEPGEVEAALRRHPEVADCAVMGREDEPGEMRLVAYVVGGAGADDLRAHLAGTLPDFMVPAAFVALDALPRTVNGKVDRGALPAPGATAGGALPRTPVEEVLAAIFAEVLELERVGVHDSFFALGGHSLLVIGVVARVREALGVELPMNALFDRPSVGELAEEVEALRRDRDRDEAPPPLLPVQRSGAFPLSFAQERLWFLDRMQPGSGAYNTASALRVAGALDRAALERSLGEIVRRHEVLRTVFAEAAGAPVQVVSPFAGFTLAVDDLTGLGDEEREAELRLRVGDEAARPFDLEAGPLFRARLVRLGATDHALLLSLHHVVCDGWSMGVLFRELSALYAAFRDGRGSPLPELSLQYADYAAWQREQLHGPALAREVAWWKARLAGVPPLLELPTDRPRPAAQSHRGAFHPVRVPAELLAELRALARRERATLYMVALAAFQLLLSRYGAGEDVLVGSPIAGRARREVEGLIGLFLNTLALRTDLAGDPPFAELLRRVRETTLGAYQHQEVPFEKLVEALQPERSLSHAPLVQVVFTLTEDEGAAAPALGDLAVRGVGSGTALARFDLSLNLTATSAGLSGALIYAADLFDDATAARMAGHLARVLEQVAADPALRVSEIDLLDPAERRAVVEEWSATGQAHPAPVPVHRLVEARAARTPEAPAVIFRDGSLAYGELDARANRLARRLAALGVGPDARVAVCLERGLELPVAVLAVLKAGGAYVPLDPGYPAQRLEMMLADSGAAVLLARGAPPLPTVPAGVAVVDVGDEREAIAGESADAPEVAVWTENLALVIYTSGSTGTPKGVGLTHGGLAGYLAWFDREVLGDEGFALPLVSRFSFDAHVRQLFPPLLRGEAVWVLPEEEAGDPAALLAALAGHGGRVSFGGVPSLWSAMLDVLDTGEAPRPEGLAAVLLGGETLPDGLAERTFARFPGVALWNHYGPTEATVNASAARVRPGAPVSIGRPVAGARVYLLDGRGRPVPTGVPGELYVGGAAVSRGYLGRPGLTAERFVPDPFSPEPGARIYRSGDRARWRESADVRECGRASDPGESERTHALAHSRTAVLEYLGRLDQQVKVRGVRIEPGEVEAVLRRQPGVRECAVAARDDAAGARRLVAYLVGEVDAAALREPLRRTLPEYLVPAAFVVLDALPRLPNGKVDRRALPAPEPGGAEGGAAPRTPTQEVLAEIWAEVLRVPRVGVNDDFFALGGHSLLATRVVSRVREVFGLELPLRALFECPTVAELAGRVEELRRAGLPALPPVVPARRGGPLPLSFAQERLWFLDRLEPDNPFYNLPSALRLSGELDAGALERALGEIVRRHEVLRTHIAEVDGVPAQVVAPFAGFALPVEDLTPLAPEARPAEAARRTADESVRPFDLAAGPLFRARLLRLGAEEHVLLLSMHHVVGDAWSTGVFFRELAALYAAYREGRESPLADLPVQYADFAVWQREQLRGQALEGGLAWWKERLAGAPALLELPADHPRPAVQSYRGAYVPVELPGGLAERLRALGRREGATLFMVLLGAFQALLAKYAGSADVVVGSPIAGRTRREVEELIGFFVNTLVLRTDLSGDPSFRALLARVREVTLGAYEHQQVQFEKLVAELQPERSLSYSPLFQVMFALENTDRPRAGLAGVRMEGAGTALTTTKFDLSLNLAHDAAGVRGALIYATDLFERETALRMAGHLARVLEQVAADPGLPLSRLELLGPAERRRVLDAWSGTEAGPPADGCVHERIAARAEQAPEAIAVTCGPVSLTRRELNERANRLAHFLRRLGVGPEVRVGLCLERSPEMVVALLAVLKAGGAYVPLDPAHPAERLAFLLADAGVAVLLTQERLRRALPAGTAAEVVAVDSAWEAVAREPAETPASGAAPANLAYVIYTSGSTGRPKGVAVEHAQLAAYLAWATRAYPAGSSAVNTPLSFDLTVTPLFVPLLCGGTVALVGEDATPEGIAARLERDGRYGMLKLTPAHLRLIAAQLGETEPGGGAECLVVGGEPLLGEHLEFWRGRFPGTVVVNEYGPTETVVGCCTHAVPLDQTPAAGQLPIGRPVPGTRLYVLDAALGPVPVGVPGELYVGGAQVTRGYLGRPAQTAARFVPDPFGGAAGARLYRTGDRARWRADGTLEYLGRLDQQVKVRGFRIEPGEVESVLAAHPAVHEARVVARDDQPGEKRLVAYVVGTADADGLRAHLRQSLPEYMVPAAFVSLERLPLTAHGKLDVRALPAPEHAAAEDRYLAPRNAVERTLAAVWAELLGRERVGVRESFFELGGDSILSIQVVSRARRAGVEITPRQMFEHQTIAELAAAAGRTAGAQPRRAEQGRVEGGARLTPIQAWFFAQEPAVPRHYNQSVLLEVDAGVGDAALEAALRAVLEHHDALRLRFRRTESGWEQWHGADAGVVPERADLSRLAPEAQDRAQAELADARQAALELEHGPLGRAVLFDRGGRGRVLLLVLHHLVVDGVSWRILRDDLERACAQAEAGVAVDLGAKSTSYRQWAQALETYAASAALAEEADYWMAQGADGVAPLPADGAGGEAGADTRTVSVRLDAEETRALLQEVPAAYRTRINDVLLCALAEAVGAWTGAPRVRLALEGHGREEEIAPGIDLTRTVGWFTSVYPVVLDLAGAPGPGERLKRVKEQLRAVPVRGIGYGVLRWLSPHLEVREALAAQPEPEISFNYMGQLDGGLAPETRFRFAGGPHGRESAAENRRRYPLAVSGGVSDGRLELGFAYGEGRHRSEAIERLAGVYLQALRGLIAHCREAGAGGCTPSDFPLAGLTQDELDAVVADGRVEDLYPLSPLQEGLLFHALGDEGPQAYQMQGAQRLEGSLDGELLRRAWAEVVARHPVLRSSFVWQGVPRPLQRVESSVEVPWVAEDWSGRSEAEQEAALARYLADDRARGFRLDAAPLLRCALFRVGPEAHWLVTSRHHLLLDGWASSRVVSQVFGVYQAWGAGRAPQPGRARPYRDYIEWLRGRDPQAAERYWRRALAGFGAPTPVGADRPATPGAPARYARRSVQIPAERTRRVHEAARHHRVTLNTLLQGAWAVLLSRYAGEEDVVFGNTVSGRPAELEGVEEMIGPFINTLPVRVRVRGAARLGPWLGELQRAQAEAREFEHAPLAEVQGWSGVPRGTPLFESLFVFENFPVEPGRAPAAGEGPRLRATASRAVEWTHYPLTLAAGPGPRLVLELSYDQARFEAATAARILEGLARVLEQMAERPDASLAQLELAGPRERRRVVEEWNRTDHAYPREACLHDLFAARVERSPDALALAWGPERLTYRELDARANRLAHHLAGLGVGPDVRVGLLLERGVEMVVATLAVMKAGGCCVPVDTGYPPERMALMLADSEARVLLSRTGLPDEPGSAVRSVVRLDAAAEALAAEPATAPRSGAVPANLAYLFYTSGSTGRPKGVMMPHAQVVQHAWCLPARMPLGAGDRVAQASNASFDAAVFEIWGALLHGAALVGIDRDALLSAALLGETLREQGITHLYQTAALFNQHVRERPDVYATLRQLVFGAEVVDTESVRRLLREGRPRRVLHEYGPTEATVWCTLEEVEAVADGAATVPIGRPVPNARIYVLGPAGEPLPPGVPGELHVGGDGVVRGYLGRPALTAERFVPDPFAPGPGARLYRTGDRARWRADGKLEFLGRFDDQVKVRGFRVEPAEIEAALATLPGVRGVRVVLREDAPGDRRLVAYLVGRVDGGGLRERLRRTLPEYMLPAAFVSVEQLPLTPNGKLDRRALPAPEYADAQAPYVAPRTPVETALAEIWARVLGVERVGTADDFFTLGGHSLLVVRLAARVHAGFGVELPIRAVFSASTLEAMAAEIERRIWEDIAAMPEAEAERLADLNPVTGD